MPIFTNYCEPRRALRACRLSLLFVALGCSGPPSVTKPPCIGSECGDLCPAGTSIEWASYGEDGCKPGQSVQRTNVRTECAESNGMSYICVPISGNDMCGGNGIDLITRSEVRCLKPLTCPEGQVVCASQSQYIGCYGGAWSPPAVCPTDTTCHEGTCTPNQQIDCKNLAPFKACGGELKGTWVISGSCVATDNGGCPRNEASVWGTLSFNGDGFVSEAKVGSRNVATYASDCPDHGACQLPPGPPGMTWSNGQPMERCVLRDGACVCTQESVVSFSKDIKLPADNYCRRGDVLDLFFSRTVRLRLVREP